MICNNDLEPGTDIVGKGMKASCLPRVYARLLATVCMILQQVGWKVDCASTICPADRERPRDIGLWKAGWRGMHHCLNCCNLISKSQDSNSSNNSLNRTRWVFSPFWAN